MHRWDRQLNAHSSYVPFNTTLLTGENSIFAILQLKRRETVSFSAPKKNHWDQSHNGNMLTLKQLLETSLALAHCTSS